MNEYARVCGTKRGKRRPLQSSPRSIARLQPVTRFCLLLAVLLLSTSGHEAALTDGVMESNNRNPARVLHLGNDDGIPESEPSEKWRHLRRSREALDREPPLSSQSPKRILTKPSPTPTEIQVPEKPSLEQATNQAPERNDTKSRFSVELSVAIVDIVNASNVTSYEYEDTLLAISKALDVIIINDTEYELHSTSNTTFQGDGANNETDAVETSWVYTLKQNNATAKKYENTTECLVDGSNETVVVTWVKAVVEYLILPERRQVNDTQESAGNDTELQLGDEGQEEEDSKDNIFEPLDEPLAERSTGHYWDWDTVGSTIVNATIERIKDGSILELIQKQSLSVVGVAQVGLENLTQCIVVDMNPTLDVPIPFIDPLDLASWDALQMFGSIMFASTLVGTLSLCFIGRNRSKALRVEHWSAMIGDESAVNDFLTVSSQFLPPECIHQRDENAAMLVTIPGSEAEPHYPINADGVPYHASNHQCNEGCRHYEL